MARNLWPHDNGRALIELADEMFPPTSPGFGLDEEQREQYRQEAREVTRHPWWPTPCERPTPWDRDFSVCANCGALISSHRVEEVVEPEMKPYRQALIDWVMKNGAACSVYGMQVWDTVIARRHFLSCGLNYAKSRPPEVQTQYEFAGTDAENTPISRVTASLTCRCGKLQGLDFSMSEDLTLGQVIYQVVKEGEGK